MPSTKIAEQIDGIERRSRNRILYCRFNESGDFRSTSDLVKLATVAELLPWLQFYGYTARNDIVDEVTDIPDNLTINGSGFMWHNEFRAVDEITGKYECAGDCRICNLCKTRRGIVIQERIRR